MRHRSFSVTVEIGRFFLSRLIVELLNPYLLINVYVLSLLFLSVSQKGSYIINFYPPYLNLILKYGLYIDNGL